MSSLINKQLLLTAYAYLFIMEQQKSQQGSAALQVEQTNPQQQQELEQLRQKHHDVARLAEQQEGWAEKTAAEQIEAIKAGVGMFKLEVYAGLKAGFIQWDHFIVASLLDSASQKTGAEVRLKLTNMKYQGSKEPCVTVLRKDRNISDSSSPVDAKTTVQRLDKHEKCAKDGWQPMLGLESKGRLMTYMTAELPDKIDATVKIHDTHIKLVHTASTTISLPQENLSLRDVLVEKLLPQPNGNDRLLMGSVQKYDLLDQNCITFSAAVYQYLNERCQKEFSGAPLAPWNAKSFAAKVTQAQIGKSATEVVDVCRMFCYDLKH